MTVNEILMALVFITAAVCKLRPLQRCRRLGFDQRHSIHFKIKINYQYSG